MTPDERQQEEAIERRRNARMATVDAMPAATRELVNVYGFKIVTTCLHLGISKPRHIRHLVETILDEMVPTRGASSSQGGVRHLGST